MTVLQSSTPLHLIFGAASSETEPLQVLRSALVVRDVTFILQSVNCFFFGSHHHRSSTRLSVFAKPTFWCLLVSSDPYNPVQAELWPAEASLSSTSWWCCWCLTPRLDWPEEVSCCDPWRLICQHILPNGSAAEIILLRISNQTEKHWMQKSREMLNIRC